MTREQLVRLRSHSAVRWLASLHAAKGEVTGARDTFLARWPGDVSADVVAQKSPVGAGDTFGTPAPMASAFLAQMQPYTLLGRIQGLRTVPFHTPITTGPTSATFAWTAAATPKVAVRLTYAAPDALLPLKITGINVLTAELLRFERLNEAIVINELRRGFVTWLDGQFVDPTLSASAGVSPASITQGAAAFNASGSSAADALNDIRDLLALYIGTGGNPEAAVLLMSSSNAIALALLDPHAFRDLRRDGGTIGGIPVIASESVGDQVVMLDASQIVVADEGQIDLSLSRAAAVEMDDDPTQDGTAGTGVSGSSLVSLWQANLVGIRLERFINWRAASGSVARISGAQYYAAGSPA